MSQVTPAVNEHGSTEPSGPSARKPDEPRPVDPMALISYLFSGILVYGLIGWGLDNWLGFDSLFLPIGVILGVAAGGYLGYMRFLKS